MSLDEYFSDDDSRHYQGTRVVDVFESENVSIEVFQDPSFQCEHRDEDERILRIVLRDGRRQECHSLELCCRSASELQAVLTEAVDFARALGTP